MWALKVKKRQS